MGPTRVGVRELRQNLSRYLRRVARGERLEVTERGKPVAVLGPIPEASTTLGRLVATGKARPPRGDVLEVPAPRGAVSSKGSQVLDELREERL